MKEPDPTRRGIAAGICLAFAAALVSGISVFVNSYGVKKAPTPTVYTTAKNLVAATALVALFAAASRIRRPQGRSLPAGRSEWLRLGVVAVVGGSVPFILFFEGLARASSTDAQFIHKTLVVWVALLAVPLLRERIGPLQVAAVALLVVGQASLVGGTPAIGSIGRGEAMILAATLLWAVEVVIAKRLLSSISPLTVGTARMAGGSVLLLAWLGLTGRLDDLAHMSASGWGWAALTGALLAVYVATWYSALSRARAIDVTAVLVPAVLVTSMLDSLVNDKALAPQRTGLLLTLVGAACAGLAAALAARRLPATPHAAQAAP